MKTIKFIFLIFTCFGLILGCSKDDTLVDDPGEMSLKKAKMASVFVVEPNGVDDTENLKRAFDDAMIAGEGSVVQLTEGKFYIDLIEVREFHGSLKGMGKGITVISSIADLNVDDFLSNNQTTNLLGFVGGDVCVRDLTIHTPQGPLSTGSKNWLHGQLGFSAITAQYVSVGEHINAVVNNVEFITQSHVRNGLIAESGFFNKIPEGIPLADIDISVTNCSFSGKYTWYGALLMHIREGSIIAGTNNNGNLFDNCMLGIWHNTSVRISVQSNTFKKQGGTCGLEIYSAPYPGYLQQIPQTFASVCNIEKNVFDVAGCHSAIIINDNRRIVFPDELPMLVQIKNNQINTGETNNSAIRCVNLSGAVFRNNKFTGIGKNGVYIFRQQNAFNENGLLLGNNFSNTNYTEATVILNVGTRNWTIVGGNLGESVLDYGENNIISGFNNNTSDVPFGQTIVDNLEEIRGPLHDLKGN